VIFLHHPVVFAVIGLCTVAATVLIIVGCVIDVAQRRVRRYLRVALAIRRRSPAIPAAPKPLPPLRRRLTDARIESELHRLGNELRRDDDALLAVLDGLFADGPHTRDH
jgi:hypothetical protein